MIYDGHITLIHSSAMGVLSIGTFTSTQTSENKIKEDTTTNYGFSGVYIMAISINAAQINIKFRIGGLW